VTEATALGAGALAGLGAGLWDQAGLAALPFDPGQRISPDLPEAGRAAAPLRPWREVLAGALARWQAGRSRRACLPSSRTRRSWPRPRTKLLMASSLSNELGVRLVVPARVVVRIGQPVPGLRLA